MISGLCYVCGSIVCMFVYVQIVHGPCHVMYPGLLAVHDGIGLVGTAAFRAVFWWNLW